MAKQYGVIPFVYDDGEMKVILVTSASGYWIFPKGHYEEDLGKQGTAELEALEEAGVEGKVDKKYTYRTKVFIKSGERVTLILYPMKAGKIHSEWQEDDRRKRVVVPIVEAEKLIASDELKECLRKFERDFRK